MKGSLSRGERGLLGAVRLVVVLTGVGMVVLAPLKAFGTVYAAVTGIQGARSIGVTFPVHVATDVPDPSAVILMPSTLPVGAFAAGVPTAEARLLAGALPTPVAIACTLAWAVPVLLTLAALFRGYRLSIALTDRSRFDRDVPRTMRVLAAWVAGAGLAWSVVGTAGSAVGVSLLDDPRLDTAVDLGPLMIGAGLAALLLVFTIVLRSATALQDDQDLTV